VLIRYENAVVRRAEGIEIRNLITKDTPAHFSLALVELNGYHPKVMNVVSDRAYYVLEGQAEVGVGESEYVVEPGDVVFIPSSTVHWLRGHMKYIVVNAPPFDPKNDRMVD